MQIWLYRRRLSVRSGAGQLVQMQAEGLERAGCRPLLAASRRRLKFLFRTGRRVQPLSPERARETAASADTTFVDHSAAIPEADIVFVHNVAATTAGYIGDTDTDRLAEEARFYAALDPGARVVANSNGVREALVEAFAFDRDRIAVLHPGYRARRFDPRVRARLRARARRALGVPDDSPLVGMVTSGNLQKRGLDGFLAAAERIADERADTHFLVAGSSSLPGAVAGHALYRGGRVHYRPRSARPERFYAALDLFLYPAVWEEFGMVVIEAMASGLPVVTSRRVGAAECLPGAYDDWVADVPEPDPLAAATLKLLRDTAAVASLIESGLAAAPPLDDRHYGDRAATLILSNAGSR